jgi:hypothetical protein
MQTKKGRQLRMAVSVLFIQLKRENEKIMPRQKSGGGLL